MKNTRRYLVWSLSLTGLLFFGDTHQALAAKSPPQRKPAQQVSCMKCHDTWSDILPKTHDPVAKPTIKVCIECHAPQGWGVAARSGFATLIHLTHLADKSTADCANCHRWKPGSALQLNGVRGKYGSFNQEEYEALQHVYLAASSSHFLDNRHLAQGVTCSACHAQGVVDQVANATCLSCHGPMATLVERTTPQQYPDRNPHKSHLGEIDCTICHVQHGQQKIYCLECHPKFDLRFNKATP